MSDGIRSNQICVSVVLPVWNPGEGILRCISSLRGQPLRGIEMIFVDDRGTDASMQAVRDAAAEDPRIRIVTNPRNLGAGGARNAGIEAARGKYLSFVDPDDYIADDFLGLLYRKAEENGLDVVKGRISFLDKDGARIERRSKNERIRDGLAMGLPLYTLFDSEHQSALYRRGFLMENGIRYGEGSNSEDSSFLLKAGLTPGLRFGLEPDAEYFLILREGSATAGFSPERMKRQLAGFSEQMEYLSSHTAPDRHSLMYAKQKLFYNMMLQFSAAGQPGMEEAAAEYLDGLRKIMEQTPYLEQFIEEEPVLKTLSRDGVCLIKKPYGLPMDSAYLDFYVRIAKAWAAYLTEKKEYSKPYAYVLGRVAVNARTDAKTLRKKGVSEEALAKFRRAFFAELCRIPLSFRLRADFWAAYILVRALISEGLPAGLRTRILETISRRNAARRYTGKKESGSSD